MIKKLDSSYFTWQRWRAGSIADLCIPCREELIIKNAYRLRMYTIGYCNGNRLMCRCKSNENAVMYFYNGRHFWFHLRMKEFDAVYNNV